MTAEDLKLAELRIKAAKDLLVLALLASSLVTSCDSRKTAAQLVGEVVNLQLLTKQTAERVDAVYNCAGDNNENAND